MTASMSAVRCCSSASLIFAPFASKFLIDSKLPVLAAHASGDCEDPSTAVADAGSELVLRLSIDPEDAWITAIDEPHLVQDMWRAFRITSLAHRWQPVRAHSGGQLVREKTCDSGFSKIAPNEWCKECNVFYIGLGARDNDQIPQASPGAATLQLAGCPLSLTGAVLDSAPRCRPASR
eukprot:5998045-Pleurochrysis_carterae.AAC.1